MMRIARTIGLLVALCSATALAQSAAYTSGLRVIPQAAPPAQCTGQVCLWLASGTNNVTIRGGAGFLLDSGVAATAGSQLVNSTPLINRGYYWNGAASTSFDTTLLTVMSDTTPSGYLDFTVNGVDRMQLDSTGALTIVKSFAQLFVGGPNGTGTVNASTFDRGASGPINVGPTNATQISIGGSNITASGNVVVQTGKGALTVAASVATTGTHPYLSVTGAASTGQTASTEINFVNFALNQTVTWATGAISQERVIRVQPTTIAFAGASTVSTAAMFAIDGPVGAGANATITEPLDMLLTYNGIGASTTAGGSVALSLQNTTAAINGTQQFAPQIEQCGAGFGTTGGTSQSVCSTLGFQPVQGTTPTGKWVLSDAINNAAYVAKWSFTDGGLFTYQGTLSSLTFGNNITYFGTSASGNHTFKSSATVSTAGNYIAEFYDASSGLGELYTGMASGAAHVFGDGIALTCSGTCTVNETACVNGNNTVGVCAATANLTTVIGVFAQTVTNATVKVLTGRQVMINCDGGVTFGVPVGTSGTNAGNVAASTPGAGAVVGKAMEATGTTTAGQCKVFVTLS